MKYFVPYYLPATIFFICAFIWGSQKNIPYALFSFLSFFILGVLFILAGKKKRKEDNEKE